MWARGCWWFDFLRVGGYVWVPRPVVKSVRASSTRLISLSVCTCPREAAATRCCSRAQPLGFPPRLQQLLCPPPDEIQALGPQKERRGLEDDDCRPHSRHAEEISVLPHRLRPPRHDFSPSRFSFPHPSPPHFRGKCASSCQFNQDLASRLHRGSSARLLSTARALPSFPGGALHPPRTNSDGGKFGSLTAADL